MPDVSVLQARLADAEVALHSLQLGQAFTEVMVNGYMTKFKAAEIGKLDAYVRQLKSEIEGKNTRGAIGFVF